MDQPAALLALAPPSEIALLDFASARVSREMIHEIAMNDRENDVPAYELAISRQLAPHPELGFPVWQSMGEVLELEKWNEPDSSAGHLKRLFACTILLRNVRFVSGEKDEDGRYFVETSAATVIQLIRSSIALGREAPRLALGFLLWLHSKQSHPMLRPFLAFGALLLQIKEDESGKNLLDTCTWVEQEEKSAREQLGDDIYSDRWMLGINYQENDMDGEDPERPERWTSTLAHVITAQSEALLPEVALRLRQMSDRLSS